MTGKETKITPENLLEKFDAGEDVSDYFDFEHGVMVYPKEGVTVRHVKVNLDDETRRVNVDFPKWVVDALDREAKRIGVGRQAVIKTWIVQHLDEMGERPA